MKPTKRQIRREDAIALAIGLTIALGGAVLWWISAATAAQP